MHSVRIRITAISITAILVSIFSVFIASYVTIQAENDRRSVEMMNLINDSTRQSLEKYFESIEQSVEMAANIASDTMDGIVLVECGVAGAEAGKRAPTSAQTERLNAYLESHCAMVREAFESVANHTHGVVNYYYCISPAISAEMHGFLYSKAGKTGFGTRMQLDAATFDVEHDVWYFEAIRRGRPVWVGPYASRVLDDSLIYSYVVPLYKAGAFVGVLGMDIPFETLAEQVSAIRVFDTGYACLVDSENRVLFHPTLSFGALPESWESVGIGDALARQSSEEQLIRYNANGVRRQMSFSTLSNGMKLLIVAPEREINASWQRLLRIIIPVTAIIIAVSALMLMLVMRIITSPLNVLTEASDRLAEGDYDAELNYRGRDEIGKLTHAFIAMRDQQKASFEDLNRQIYTDALTGLANMRYFFKLADTERKAMREAGQRPAVLFFNLIGMKHFNRQYGFDEGDRLLRAIAQILKRRFDGHSVSHFNQDHFVALTDEDHIAAVLPRVFGDFAQANGGLSLPVKVGVYQDRIEDVDITVACDRAKYACDHIRGSYVSEVCYFNDAMFRQAENTRYIINHLDQALSEGWVKVYYQAIVRASNGLVCDEEALARWVDPVRGILPPGDFIPILEDAHLIYRLDLYMLDRIIEKLRDQKRAGLHLVPQSLNLSRLDFDSCDMVEEIRRRLDDAGVEHALVTIEITESVVGSELDFIKAQVDRFHALGFKVWMDDFGSGYSSLDVLQDIRFDLIKFDMRFMHGFDGGDKNRVILTELMKMASGLGVETVCEGVETREQVEFLQEIGCTKLQGYYYTRPIPMEEILERNRKGTQIGFEDPAETDYYVAIGRINLYDTAMLANADEALRRYFDTLPMAILEVHGTRIRYNRTNRTYREFLKGAFGMTLAESEAEYDRMAKGTMDIFMTDVVRCSREGKCIVVDEYMGGKTIHTLLRRVAVNPVNGTAAVAMAVVAVEEDRP